MAIEILTARPGELHLALEPISHYFGRGRNEERGRIFERILPADRIHVAYDDGRIVGSTGAYAFDLTVPGGRLLPAAGIVAVGVLPTHRRRGVLTGLMRTQLGAVHERGEPLAYLWASEDVIYGRFGYGIATFSGSIDIERDRAQFHAFERRASLRLLDAEEVMDVLTPIYERVAAETPGMFVRTPAWWEVRLLPDPEHRREGGGELTRRRRPRRPGRGIRRVPDALPGRRRDSDGSREGARGHGRVSGSRPRALALPLRDRLGGTRQG